ncbi:histidine phosphatase family protein [Citricoccus sp. K5]|uniref:histidine phosphatase family protein n=1 Tax=Citricoccus sp. K5 TaxID=2653135 RepID=UPI0012F0E903|nr:histidine phosphatase family protein [Citricoccus sp. K5]VXB29164.1 Putative phosphoglycerate mutase [Citricoccus sp. K5]
MMRLILVRHGETTWNLERRLQGQRDIGLSTTGREQAFALLGAIRRLAPEYVVSAELARARETAELLGAGLDATDDRLNEAFLGSWEGCHSAELKASTPELYEQWRAGQYQPPGAECFTELTDRVVAGVDQAIRDAHARGLGTLMVVTHGGPVRAYLRAAVGLDPARTVPSHPASLSCVDVDPAADSPSLAGTARLRLFNFAPALSLLDPSD